MPELHVFNEYPKAMKKYFWPNHAPEYWVLPKSKDRFET